MNDTPFPPIASHQASAAETPRSPTRSHDPVETLRHMVVAWRERSQFRTELERKLRGDPHLIDDIGLTRRQSRRNSPGRSGKCFEVSGAMTPHQPLPPPTPALGQRITTPREDPVPWAALAGIIATVTVFAVAQGLTYPLLSFILERQGTAPALIGLSAAMTPLGFILSAPFIPMLARRLGGGRLAILCSVLAALTLAAIAWTLDVRAWMPLRFLLGVFANPLSVVSETWLVTITPASRRGRIMGLYSSVVSAGFCIGPLSLSLVGAAGWPPFVIGIVAFIICGLIVLAVVPRLPDMPRDGAATSVVRFFTLAPLLLLAVATAAAFEQTLLSLLAVYGAALGSTEQRIAPLVTCFIAGNAALQIVLGRLAEHIGSRRTMLSCVLASLLGCLLMPLLFNGWLIWPLVFVWGGVTFGIFTLSLVQLGERFTGQVLVAGNAAFALAWGVGGIVGSPATGLVMQFVGHQGLPLSLGLLCAVLAGLLMIDNGRR